MMIGRWLNGALQPAVARWLLAALLVVLVAAPWLLGDRGQYTIVLLMTVFIFAVLGYSWNLLAGFCGLLSFGTQVYVGLAGFTVAILTYYFGASVWVGMAMGGVVAAAFAWLLAAPVSDRHARRNTLVGVGAGVVLWIAYEIVIAFAPGTDIFGGTYIRRVIILFSLFLLALPLLKLEGAYFAVATWLIAAAVASIFNEWRVVGAGGGMTIASDTTVIQRYYAALILVVAATLVVWWLLRSRYGLALTAVRDDAEAASAVGVDIRRVKTMVFVIAAPMAGLAAGLFYIDQVTITPPDAFHIRWSAYVVFIVVAGGMGTLEGPLIGAVLFVIVQRMLVGVWGGGELTLGIAAVLLILLLPRGVAGLIADLRGAADRRGDGGARMAAFDEPPKAASPAGTTAPPLPAAGPLATPAGGAVAGALLPASPVPFLKPDAAPWAGLASAALNAGRRLSAASPDAIVVMSTTWAPSAGTPLMGRSRLKGARPDETWHAFGSIAYDLHIDLPLTRAVAQSATGRDHGTRLVEDDRYPVDMGIIMAAQWLAPLGPVPLVLVGRNAHGGPAGAAALGRAVAAAARSQGKRVAVVAVGGLSLPERLPPIDPGFDAIATAEDDALNRALLGSLERADWPVLDDRIAFPGAVSIDGGGHHLAFLAGALGTTTGGTVLAYSAIQGGGAAVVFFGET